MPSVGPRRPTRLSRRAYLAALGAGALASLAGCSQSSGGVSAEELTPSDGTNAGWSRQIKLTPTDERVSHFGSAVDLAGDARTALVTATHHETDDGFYPGPAYVLELVDGGWRQQATLAPDGGEDDMDFGGKGGSASLSDDATTVLIGAQRADEPHGPQAGAAYVFERTDESWSDGVKLVADDGDKQDFFGMATALSQDGSTALIGAWGNNTPGDEGAGTAYVFERTDDGWNQTVTLAPEGAGAFGWSVDLASDGRTALVGAPADDDPNGEDAGSVYVFERTDGGAWRQRATFAADDGDADDFFGVSVALAGETALVGAGEDDDPYGERAGSAYVFERTDGGWAQQAKLVADDGDPIDLFGVAVALARDGTTALLGARVDEDPNGEDAGSAYVFERADGGWRQQAKLAAADGESHVFGRSVALARDTALIGTMRPGAYVFSNGSG